MYTKGLINKKTKDFLIPCHPKTAKFYHLPKIHKPGNPSRPIVASNGAPTEKISSFVDHFLQPLVTKLPSYIWDFLNKLQRMPTLPPGSLLVTLDVSSLYTNIPHNEGIVACEEALNSRESPAPPTADLCHLIWLILSLNSFVFNQQH